MLYELTEGLGRGELRDVGADFGQTIPEDCLLSRLGIRLVRVGRGASVATMPVGRGHLNQRGIAQAGAVVALADAAAGWASYTALEDSRFTTLALDMKLIRPVDDLRVWSIICMVVRGGYRRRGVNRQMVLGALEYAKSLGAPAVEAYPVDPEGRMDLTMAYVGTRKMFEEAGFEVVGVSDAVASRMPRLIMRKML